MLAKSVTRETEVAQKTAPYDREVHTIKYS